MPIIKWSGLLSGSHKIRQIKEFEATSKREIIPPETPILYYETVSWWRSPFRKPPLQTEWRYLNHVRVAYWYFPADSDAFRAFNKFVQGLF